MEKAIDANSGPSRDAESSSITRNATFALSDALITILIGRPSNFFIIKIADSFKKLIYRGTVIYNFSYLSFAIERGSLKIPSLGKEVFMKRI